MAGDASRQNGKLGGKPKGYKAPHTLKAQEERARAIALVDSELEAIFIPQIEKAKKGDTSAFNAVLDRAWGKPLQGVEMTGKDGKDLFQEPSERIRKLADKLIGIQNHEKGE